MLRWAHGGRLQWLYVLPLFLGLPRPYSKEKELPEFSSARLYLCCNLLLWYPLPLEVHTVTHTTVRTSQLALESTCEFSPRFTHWLEV
jgi:hypothetical protein